MVGHVLVVNPPSLYINPITEKGVCFPVQLMMISSLTFVSSSHGPLRYIYTLSTFRRLFPNNNAAIDIDIYLFIVVRTFIILSHLIVIMIKWLGDRSRTGSYLMGPVWNIISWPNYVTLPFLICTLCFVFKRKLNSFLDNEERKSQQIHVISLTSEWMYFPTKTKLLAQYAMLDGYRIEFWQTKY